MGAWWEVVRFLADKAVSWPIVLLVAIWKFGKPLAALLSSHKVNVGVGKEGFTLSAEKAVVLQEKTEIVAKGGLPVTERDKFLEAARKFDVPAIAVEQANLIRADLQKLQVGQEEQIDLLIKHLAVTQLHYRAENIYRIIFGSQIALLKQLNTTGPGSRTEVLSFYEKAKVAFPQLYDNFSSEHWMNFLLERHLIIAQGFERYDITVAGKEFLKWMTDQGVLENKPF